MASSKRFVQSQDIRRAQEAAEVKSMDSNARDLGSCTPEQSNEVIPDNGVSYGSNVMSGSSADFGSNAGFGESVMSGRARMENKVSNKPTRKLSLRRDERGLSTVEYVIILVLIAVAGIGLWTNFGKELSKKITDSTTDLKDNVDKNKVK